MGKTNLGRSSQEKHIHQYWTSPANSNKCDFVLGKTWLNKNEVSPDTEEEESVSMKHAILVLQELSSVISHKGHILRPQDIIFNCVPEVHEFHLFHWSQLQEFFDRG